MRSSLPVPGPVSCLVTFTATLALANGDTHNFPMTFISAPSQLLPRLWYLLAHKFRWPKFALSYTNGPGTTIIDPVGHFPWVTIYFGCRVALDPNLRSIILNTSLCSSVCCQQGCHCPDLKVNKWRLVSNYDDLHLRWLLLLLLLLCWVERREQQQITKLFNYLNKNFDEDW